MPSKNNLSALKKLDAAPILPANEAERVKPVNNSKKTGRKPSKEKRSYKVLLSLTEGQGLKLEEKAGLAGGATVIYDHLLKTGFFN